MMVKSLECQSGSVEGDVKRLKNMKADKVQISDIIDRKSDKNETENNLKAIDVTRH